MCSQAYTRSTKSHLTGNHGRRATLQWKSYHEVFGMGRASSLPMTTLDGKSVIRSVQWLLLLAKSLTALEAAAIPSNLLPDRRLTTRVER